MPGYYKVFGSRGWLQVDEFGYEGQHLTASFSAGQGQPLTKIDEINPEKDPKHFERQADHFSRCILENRTPDTPGEEGLKGRTSPSPNPGAQIKWTHRSDSRPSLRPPPCSPCTQWFSAM